jgi:hypothetical protein
VGHLACIEGTGNLYKILERKPKRINFLRDVDIGGG